MNFLKTLMAASSAATCTVLSCVSAGAATDPDSQPAIRTGNRWIGNVPTMISYRDDGMPKPLVFLLHGFTGRKEQTMESAFARRLVDRGCFVVAIDNRGHGERAGGYAFFPAEPAGAIDLGEIRRAIKDTADEIPALIDALAAEPQVDAARVAVSGVSMGGFITWRAASIDRRITVAAPVIASPYWEDVPERAAVPIVGLEQTRALAGQFSPALRPEALAHGALLVQLGGDDGHFRGSRVVDFCERELRPLYATQPERLRCVVWPGVGHAFTEEMQSEALGWIERFLVVSKHPSP